MPEGTCSGSIAAQDGHATLKAKSIHPGLKAGQRVKKAHSTGTVPSRVCRFNHGTVVLRPTHGRASQNLPVRN